MCNDMQAGWELTQGPHKEGSNPGNKRECKDCNHTIAPSAPAHHGIVNV